MSKKSADKQIYEGWMTCLNIMVGQGVAPEVAASTMLAIAVTALRTEWGGRRVAEMLSGVALEIVAEVTRREEGAAAEGAAGLDDIVRSYAQSRRAAGDGSG